MFKAIVIAVVVLIAAVLVFAATRPDSFRIERTIGIKAPPEKVFGFIDDFRQWPAWSPWENKDPAMKRTLGQVARGKGAVYEWDGDKNVGQGRMEITESSPPSRVAIKLDFIKPFEAHNAVEFTLRSEGDTTRVTWAMQGPSPYLSKLMGLFFSMDRMVGGDFETGLANLRTAAER